MSKKGIDTHRQYIINHRVNDIGNIERRCSVCQKWKEETLDNFYLKNIKKPEIGYAAACKRCSSKKAYKYNQEHPEQLKISKKKDDAKLKNKLRRRKNTQRLRSDGFYDKYYQDNPDKQKQYSENHRQHDITEFEWRNCLKVFNYKCAYCGISEQEAKKKYKQVLHKDHVDHNGYNDLRNAVPGCKQCNSYKWQYDFEEWYRQQEFFTEEKLAFIKWWITEGYKDYIEEKLPYRIIREKNKDNNKYHFNLWSVDEKRNLIEIIETKNKKKDLEIIIKELLLKEVKDINAIN